MDIDRLAKIVEAEVKKAIANQTGSILANMPNQSNPSGKNILALFTGGYTKLSEALAQIEKLIQSSYQVDVVMSISAVKVIGQDKIRSISGIGNIICEPDDTVSSLKIIQEKDFIVIPVLTRNTAAKLALGITDTLVTNIVMQALISSKPVISARNSADPKDADCPCVGMLNTPPALIKLAENYLQKLETYGIKLVDVSDIAQVVFSSANKENPLNLKLITHDTIANLPPNTKQLTLAKDAIITPLAKDKAKELGLKLIIVDK